MIDKCAVSLDHMILGFMSQEKVRNVDNEKKSKMNMYSLQFVIKVIKNLLTKIFNENINKQISVTIAIWK